MSKLFGPLCGLLLVAGPAFSATSFTGSFDASGREQGYLALSGYPNGTSFNFYFTTSAPVINGVGQYTYEAAFDDYFDGSSTPFGGDNSPTNEAFSIPASFSQALLITPRSFDLYYPDGNIMERNYFYADDVSVNVVVPVAYAGVSFTFGISPIVAIPEPATWAMMVAGFGVLGVMLRKSRRLRTF